MVISRTPYRISFFGGGTDYPAWYLRHGGSVIATTINKYCYITCRYLPPFFDHKYRIVYSKTEGCNDVDAIIHPSVRETIRFLNIERGLEIHHDGDLPARSGIGSSSAFTVGLLNALYALKGAMPGKRRLAKESIYLEQDVMKETVGSQDQVLAAYGGFNHILFHPGGEITVQPVILPFGRLEELQSYLMLFYTGVSRTASDVAGSYVKNIDNQRRQLRVMGDLVEEAVSILGSGEDLKYFGELLNEGWQTKRTLSASVSNTMIDEIYNEALSAGALGGKLIGAGGGGFVLLFAPQSCQDQVKRRLSKLLYIPIKFDFQGSQVIFVDQEEEYYPETHRQTRILKEQKPKFRAKNGMVGVNA